VNRPAWSRLAKLIAVLIFAVAAGIWTVGQLREREVARREQQEVARMTSEMKTVCLGRFLIDMPEESELALVRPRINGLDISSFDEPEADFQKRLVQREARLRAAPDRLGGNRNLESVRAVKTDNGVLGKIFVHSRTVTEGTQARGLELERYHYEGVAVEALVHGKGMSFDISSSDYDPAKVENLAKLVAKLVPNPTNEAPTEPGFCVYRAWFRDPLTADQGEEIMMHAQLPSHPDIQFLTILAAGNKPATQGLLERTTEAEAGLTPDEKKRISNLRADQRTISGIAGDEVLTRVVENNHAVVYGFWWEVNGTEDNVLIPHLSFTMDVGKGDYGPVPSSLSQDAAMALWDKILSSIRLHQSRPGQDARPMSADRAPGKRDAQRGT
jgi:hypothetical protein